MTHKNKIPSSEDTALENHEVLLQGATLSISLPKDYVLATKELLASHSFYKSDVARTPMDPIYISLSEHRSFVSIHVYDHSEDSSFSKLHDTAFESNLKNRFLMQKDYSPRMPLVEKHSDKKGNPYAYIMHITRYASSDTAWRNYPKTDICPTGADSVECAFYYYTLRGYTEYIIQCYSLESFESFSYDDKRAIIESINIKSKTRNRHLSQQ